MPKLLEPAAMMAVALFLTITYAASARPPDCRGALSVQDCECICVLRLFLRSLLHSCRCAHGGCRQWSRLHHNLVLDLGEVHLELVADALLPAVLEVEKYVLANITLAALRRLKIIRKYGLTPSCWTAPASAFLNHVSNFLLNFQFFFFSSTAARYCW